MQFFIFLVTVVGICDKLLIASLFADLAIRNLNSRQANQMLQIMQALSFSNKEHDDLAQFIQELPSQQNFLVPTLSAEPEADTEAD